MRRREVLKLLSIAIWPTAARAQPRYPLVGLINDLSSEQMRAEVAAFEQGLAQSGFQKDQNVRIEYRWAEGSREALEGLAKSLVREGVAVMVSGNDLRSITAAKDAADGIPVVFVANFDPALEGIISHERSTKSNITGVTVVAGDLIAKRLEILHACAPNFSAITALVNPQTPNISVQLQYVSEAAKRLGVSVHVLNAFDEESFQTAVDEIAAHHRVEPLLVENDGLFNAKQDALVALATKYRLPAAFGNRAFAEAGGLVSYGPSMLDAYSQAGLYVARILSGTAPANLPIAHPIKFELVVNTSAAKSLNLTISRSVLAQAAEVIE